MSYQFTTEELAEYECLIDQLVKALDLINTELTRLTPDQAEQDHHLGRLNIIGFGIGSKFVGGKWHPDTAALSVFVVRKAPKEEVDPDYLAENLVRRITGRTDLVVNVVPVGNPHTLSLLSMIG